jgi:aryl-alcohol dehydrogenase-like predicted oxidoreductase
MNLTRDELCIGGSVFGWSVSKKKSYEILDKFLALGGKVIDTSDFYSQWVPGNQGGESESIIGEWHRAKSNRSQIRIITKVGLSAKRLGFHPKNIVNAAEDSLARLKSDYIDVYMPHRDMNLAEQDQWCESIEKLFKQGKILSIGFSHCSLLTMKRVRELLRTTNLPISIVESNFNCIERDVEKEIIPWTQQNGFEFMAARALAGGFLTGKYHRLTSHRARVLLGTLSHLSSRGIVALRKEYRASLNSSSVSVYMNNQHEIVLSAMRKLARKYEVNTASIAYSWLLHQNGVKMACMSFRTLHQLASLKRVVLQEDEISLLNSI